MKFILLWHMHQPVYKNGLTGEYELPWVFLHSIKDYYEMAYYAKRFPKLKLTFNLTPSLLTQIEEYASGKANCRFLKLIRKPVKELSLIEKSYLLRIFLSSSPKLLKNFDILKNLSLHSQNNNAKEICKNLSNQDFLNAEVAFLLSWCSSYLRRENKTVKKLFEEKSAYSEEDKNQLILELLNHIREIIPLYKELLSSGQIEITTTPFYHPILPLLLDMNVAKESSPDVKLPALHVSLKEDALTQLTSALSYHEKTFGKPKGVWLAEGGISEDAVKLLSQQGVEWTATDEEILFKSIQEKSGTREPLYRVYSYKGVKIFFRDRELSDLIGFTYQNWNPEEAVKDFISRLKRISDSYPDPVVSVTLDGENCWEFYEDNGTEFRENLYRAILDSPFIETVKPSEVDSSTELPRLFPGSWIGGNFLTWVGDEEKNRAWELLGTTKLQVERKGQANQRILNHILISEGSDWFWWFGKVHHSHFFAEFDRLFRSNLIKVYRELGIDIPSELLHPIKTSVETFAQPPKGYVSATIDGEVTDYFEWLNAGRVSLVEISTMDSSSFIMREAFYGCDKEKNFFLRIDGNWKRIQGRKVLVKLEFSGKESLEIAFNINTGTASSNCSRAKLKLGKVLEVFIPSECIAELLKDKVRMVVKLFVDGKLLETAPPFTPTVLETDREFEDDWMV